MERPHHQRAIMAWNPAVVYHQVCPVRYCVVRVLPSLLLIGFLIAGGLLWHRHRCLYSEQPPRECNKRSCTFSNAPEVQVEKTDLSAVSEVQAGTKLKYTAPATLLRAK